MRHTKYKSVQREGEEAQEWPQGNPFWDENQEPLILTDCTVIPSAADDIICWTWLQGKLISPKYVGSEVETGREGVDLQELQESSFDLPPTLNNGL